jgi:murein DD-endopeptidase MepM/ murein hydrolase activator NlpD
MKVILVSKRPGGIRSFTLGSWARALLSVCLVGLPVSAATWAALHYANGDTSGLLNEDTARAWSEVLSEQEQQILEAQRDAETKLAALTLRVAELQARLVRLDALGERLTSIAKLDKGEFDFSQPPALGGPETSSPDEPHSAPDFESVIGQLAKQIEDRQQQLETLETLLANRKIQRDLFIAGRPIKKGWMSSRYGRRTDPFTGRIAWHSGVDFAGKDGADIVAVAAGVVTWSAERHGYGQMVEISHGNGYSTRYAHCKENLVKVGDVVKKGQIIALMGSTGRSTGPHVHFEVYKHGRAVDPATYIHRASR